MSDGRRGTIVPEHIYEAGLASAGYPIELQDGIWVRHSDDKIDIARQTGKVFAAIFARLGIRDDLRTLSLGCGIEPQLALFQALSSEIFLLDIEHAALETIKKNTQERFCNNVHPIHQDFTAFLDEDFARTFCREQLAGPLDTIFLHHSLYYLPQADWQRLLTNLYTHLLNPGGCIHGVLMSSRCENVLSTTWLYNHFAGEFCNHKNDQDLLLFAQQLQQTTAFCAAQIATTTAQIQFKTGDFSELMSVIWMILLYPQVHSYTGGQMTQIIGHVYEKFFMTAQPLLQEQDHLVITKPMAKRP